MLPCKSIQVFTALHVIREGIANTDKYLQYCFERIRVVHFGQLFVHFIASIEHNVHSHFLLYNVTTLPSYRFLVNPVHAIKAYIQNNVTYSIQFLSFNRLLSDRNCNLCYEE